MPTIFTLRSALKRFSLAYGVALLFFMILWESCQIFYDLEIIFITAVIMGNECDICEKIDDDSNRRNTLSASLNKGELKTSQLVGSVAQGK